MGRIELLTHAEEAELVSALEAAAGANGSLPLESLDRFAEPRLSRAMEQLTAPKALELAKTLRDMAHAKL